MQRPPAQPPAVETTSRPSEAFFFSSGPEISEPKNCHTAGWPSTLSIMTACLPQLVELKARRIINTVAGGRNSGVPKAHLVLSLSRARLARRDLFVPTCWKNKTTMPSPVITNKHKAQQPITPTLDCSDRRHNLQTVETTSRPSEAFSDLAPRSLSQRTAIPQAGPALYSEASMALCQSICKQACGSRLTPATDQWLFAKAHAIQACGSRLTPS